MAARGTSSAFDHLPAAVRRLLPELAEPPWPAEARADCARCPMVAPPAEARPWSFAEATRCCTAHPSLANFLAGGALRRGGAGRDRVLARLARPDGVSPWGIDAPADYDRAIVASGDHGFGRDPALRCPYWAGGAESCGVWRDRSAVCRTWYCKHDDGLRGAVEWSEVGTLLAEVESRLAKACIAAAATEAAVVSATPEPASWAAWFEWCAAHVERLDDASVEAIATPALVVKRHDLVSLRRRQIIPPNFVVGLKAVMGDPKRDSAKALEYCAARPGPLAGIFTAAIKKLGEPLELLERAIQEAGRREIFKLRKFLRSLGVVGSVAPLLGLLGTIFGMISAFQTVAVSGESLGRTELLAKGIYEALITTAAGLIVAIPTVIAHHMLSAKVERLVFDMDAITIDFVEEYASSPKVNGGDNGRAASKPERTLSPNAGDGRLPINVGPVTEGVAHAVANG